MRSATIASGVSYDRHRERSQHHRHRNRAGVIFAADVPLIIAFTVARYSSPPYSR
ncbi:MAG: hypothetical protein JO345_42050 [Streptosporangiaceae bacterium]|nr:hypothetical protein [Streptosporangiaceae bacterium]